MNIRCNDKYIRIFINTQRIDSLLNWQCIKNGEITDKINMKNFSRVTTIDNAMDFMLKMSKILHKYKL